jgi:DNA polymerase III alpha subunit
MAGCFNNLVKEAPAREILWKLLELDLAVQEKEAVQTSIFQLLEDSNVSAANNFKTLTPMERLEEDFGAYGLTTHGHPMKILKQQWPNLPHQSAAEIKQNKSGTIIKAAGLAIIRQRPPTAKGCVFSTLEDETGFLDLILHPKTYERCKEVFMQHCFLIVTGELQRDTKTTSIIVKSMKPIFEEKSLDNTPLPIEPTTYFYG